MHRGVLFLVLLLANTVGAATQFRFVMESTGDPLYPKTAGTVRVEGASYRIDYEEAGPFASAAFSTDGGNSVTYLDEKLSTYYVQKKTVPAKGMSSGLYDEGIPHIGTPPVVSVKDVVLREEPAGEVIAGFETRKYVLRFMHDLKTKIYDENIRVVFRSTAELWTTEKLDLPFLPIDPRLLLMGQSVVDPVVREALSGVKGIPLKRRLTVTRQIAAGMVMTDVTTTTFDDFKTIELPPEALTVPKGYRYQEPVIGFGGE